MISTGRKIYPSAAETRGIDPDTAYRNRLAAYLKTVDNFHPQRARMDAEEVRKFLACIEGEGSPKTKECREYRAWVLDRLRAIVNGEGYPRWVIQEGESTEATFND